MLLCGLKTFEAISTIPKPLTVTHQTVTSMFIRTVQNQSIKRWLGLSLVLFIFYGTTVEAAHRHGRVLPATDNAAASLVAPGSGTNTLNTTPGCSDCLICQLHQNFSATLISVKPNTEAVSRLTHLLRVDPVSIRSIHSSPQSGRAPPQAN